ncbi:MAG: serine/threonine-protein kinase [Acidobacteriota bacterium]
MANTFHLKLFELLEEAQDWPEHGFDREQRAAELCAAGPVSAEELLAALDRADQLSGFLEGPAWEAGRASATEPEPWAERQVGRYRLEDLLGSGGMGQVFLAEQEEPRRKVALKLIRSEAVSEAAIERFRAEQLALARLNHPNVAQLLDAGVTAEDRPFFAMELVDGLPIHAFLEERRLGLEERLLLFLEICAAGHHAHQKQIVHRDLKPSNILVREIDGRATVKVIDFGIAQALDRPTAGAQVTESGGIYGTPEYLSPESFDGDVDTRADIYALGALLYELVTGARPFRRGASKPAELIERIRRGVRESVSARALRSGVAWASRIGGDLEAVIDRAMEPDRDCRYGSVVDLVADVERFLEHRPVSVRSAGPWHQVRLLFRRRRGSALAATVAALSIAAGSGAGAFGLLQARHEAELARQALRESEAMSGFLFGIFQESDPDRAKGEEITARELLDQGVERLDEDLRDQPKIRAQVTRTIGDIYARLGHFEQAEGLLKESLTLFEEQFGDEPLQEARALSGLGVMKSKAGEIEAGRSYFERALAVLEEHPDLDSNLTALTVYHLGALSFRAQAFDEAAASFDRACALWQRQGGDAQYRARCFDALGAIRLEQGRLKEARDYFLSALEVREVSLGSDHLHVANSLENLCMLEAKLMALQAAEAHCRQALAIRSRALGEDHEQSNRTVALLAVPLRLRGELDASEALVHRALDSDLAAGRGSAASKMWTRLGWTAWLRGDYSEAMRRYREAIAVQPASFSDHPPVAQAYFGIGLSLWKQGRLEEAENQLQEVIEFRRNHNGPRHQLTAGPMWGLAGVYRDRGTPEDLARAGDLYREVLDIRRTAFPENHEKVILALRDYRELLSKVDGKALSLKTSAGGAIGQTGSRSPER